MNSMQRNICSTVFALVVIGLAAFIMQRFFLPLIWAGIMSIATWPLYQRVLVRIGGRTLIAAVLLTTLLACAFLIPIFLGLRQAIEEAPMLANFIANANSNGIAPPVVIERIPFAGVYVQRWWVETLAQPHGLAHLFSEGSSARLVSASAILKSLGSQLFRRMIDFGFAFLCLFFFFKDGQVLNQQIVNVGGRWFGPRRWQRYHEQIPTAVRATVNGLVLVGLGEGLLIGVGYAFAGLPSPALWGAITGVLAIMPFGAPLVYLCAAAMLAASGAAAAAIGVAAWGTVVLFCADHFIRPTLIGNATRLPFLAVLFGILGGVETLGLVGLFVGPVLMVLFITLWHEAGVALIDDTQSIASAENKHANAPPRNFDDD